MCRITLVQDRVGSWKRSPLLRIPEFPHQTHWHAPWALCLGTQAILCLKAKGFRVLPPLPYSQVLPPPNGFGSSPLLNPKHRLPFKPLDSSWSLGCVTSYIPFRKKLKYSWPAVLVSSVQPSDLAALVRSLCYAHQCIHTARLPLTSTVLLMMFPTLCSSSRDLLIP